jgi:hypothetical protein
MLYFKLCLCCDDELFCYPFLVQMVDEATGVSVRECPSNTDGTFSI